MEQQSFLATGTDGVASFESSAGFESAAALGSAAALKQIAAERLAAHRSRRTEAATLQAEREARVRARADALRRENSHGASRVRDAVAARYRESVSYREYLAAEAERALEQAQAEAEIAARNAQAVAEAQMKLLEELDQWNRSEAQPEPSPRERAIAEQRAATRGELAHALADIALGARELAAEPPSLSIVELPPQTEMPAPGRSSSAVEGASVGLHVRLHERLRSVGPTTQTNWREDLGSAATPMRQRQPVEMEEIEELDQEIEFRSAPEFEDHTLEASPIQANIIEFPRQLIASRKARPRLAEGPLREETLPQPQLRIFEVEPEQISVEPAVEEASGAPEWQSLLLDATAPAAQPAGSEFDARLTPLTAPLSRRVMALVVDGCCVACGLVAFATVVAEIAGPVLRGAALPVLGGAAAGTLVALALLYQMLFFSLAGSTPGMRYARISLCTFNDENPTRKAMRRRIFAVILAACPLGLGLVWMALDGDRLGWHDRISRMYPRAY